MLKNVTVILAVNLLSSKIGANPRKRQRVSKIQVRLIKGSARSTEKVYCKIF